MEVSELIFGLIDTMNEPVLLLEEDSGERVALYSNKLMKNLTQEKAAGIKNDETPDNKAEFDELLPSLLESYDKESNSESYTIHEQEIFGSIYDIHFSKQEKYLLMFFIEVKLKDIFENITTHSLGEACKAIVVILDSKGNLIDSNGCFSNIVGIKKSELLGKNFFESFIPGDLKKLQHYLGDILKKDVYHQQFVTPLKGDNENIYRINWQVSKIIKHNQTYIVAVGSDISKFIDEIGELKKQLTSIKVGFDYFPLAVGYMDADGVFTKTNPRFKKMFCIADSDSEVSFDKIKLFKKHIGFAKMNENIKLIKELSYKIDTTKGKKLKVDIRLLSGKKESSKLYIVVAQKIK